MRILLTGYPGFLAEEIYHYFAGKGAVVDTLGLGAAPENHSGGRHMVCNLAHEIPNLGSAVYDMVIHAAGKAHVVPRSPEEAEMFFKVNRNGTEHLLKALSAAAVKSIVFISSVAVYGAESGVRITENAPLAARDPYGLSKIEAENLISTFPFSNPVIRGIVRLPLIAGPGAPGNLGSMFKAMKKGLFFNIGKGTAQRSVILRSDVPAALELIASKGGIYNITDGRDLSFAELAEGIHKLTPFRRRPNLPCPVACCMALAGEVLQKIFGRNMPFNFKRYRQMTQSLTFSGEKAQAELNFVPHVVLENLQELIQEK